MPVLRRGGPSLSFAALPSWPGMWLGVSHGQEQQIQAEAGKERAQWDLTFSPAPWTRRPPLMSLGRGRKQEGPVQGRLAQLKPRDQPTCQLPETWLQPRPEPA